MRRITQEELDMALLRIDGALRGVSPGILPAGHYNGLEMVEPLVAKSVDGYSSVSVDHAPLSRRFFPSGCQFSDGVKFGHSNNFGNRCSFGASTYFGASTFFGKHCYFGPNCYFESKCRFGPYSQFGEQCAISTDSILAGDCLYEGVYGVKPGPINIPLATPADRPEAGYIPSNTKVWNFLKGYYIRTGNFLGTYKELEKAQGNNSLLLTLVVKAIQDLTEQ